MTDYRRCSGCGKWGWFDRPYSNHVCAPTWEARLVGDDDWIEIHATDAEEAAEEFCEQYDSGGEYDIIRRGSAEVEVRKPGETEASLWEVSAESVPQYRAYERKPSQSPQETKGEWQDG